MYTNEISCLLQQSMRRTTCYKGQICVESVLFLICRHLITDKRQQEVSMHFICISIFLPVQIYLEPFRSDFRSDFEIEWSWISNSDLSLVESNFRFFHDFFRLQNTPTLKKTNANGTIVEWMIFFWILRTKKSEQTQQKQETNISKILNLIFLIFFPDAFTFADFFYDLLRILTEVQIKVNTPQPCRRFSYK